jgi:AcrR family transcriptional regulator
MNDIPRPRRTRADAVRNREQILRATIDLLVEDGPTVALETIARRARVGIATLYRHFPDRSVLLRQVAVDMLQQSTTVANTALAEEPDAFQALIRFMHAAIELRMGVIMPMLAERVAADDELFAVRDESKRALEAIVKAAHDEQSLRPDVGPGDISLLVIRVARPLPVPITAEANRRLSHRHLELILDGLVNLVAVDALPGRPMQLNELATLPPDSTYDEPVVVDPSGLWQGSSQQGVRPSPAADTEDRSTTNGS